MLTIRDYLNAIIPFVIGLIWLLIAIDPSIYITLKIVCVLAGTFFCVVGLIGMIDTWITNKKDS